MQRIWMPWNEHNELYYYFNIIIFTLLFLFLLLLLLLLLLYYFFRAFCHQDLKVMKNRSVWFGAFISSVDALF